MTPAFSHEPGVRARRARAGERRPRRAPSFGPSLNLTRLVKRLGLVSTQFGGALFLLSSVASATSDAAKPLLPDAALPSGQIITPVDMALEDQPDGQLFLVLRYLAPRIAREGGDLGYADVVADLDALCEGPGRDAAQMAISQGAEADQLLVVLMDRAIPRGETDPDATSFIAAYSVTPEGCVFQ